MPPKLRHAVQLTLPQGDGGSEAKPLVSRIKRSKRSGTYEFLEKKKSQGKAVGKGTLQSNSKWWHGVFFFSTISFLACVITLWAPYPIGARMPTEEVAKQPWSDGCKGDLQSCICPRETICADDLLSMIFLTIARCSAWFDYPLYMCLFLTKARNLNNYLQSTMIKCWIDFSDSHKVHALFGIIVGIESMAHGFFHILRWARRKDDIKVRGSLFCLFSFLYHIFVRTIKLASHNC